MVPRLIRQMGQCMRLWYFLHCQALKVLVLHTQSLDVDEDSDQI